MTTAIEIDIAAQRALRSLWRDVHARQGAANCFSHDNPSRQIQLEIAKHTLDIYFDAIDTALKTSGYLK